MLVFLVRSVVEQLHRCFIDDTRRRTEVERPRSRDPHVVPTDLDENGVGVGVQHLYSFRVLSTLVVEQRLIGVVKSVDPYFDVHALILRHV